MSIKPDQSKLTVSRHGNPRVPEPQASTDDRTFGGNSSADIREGGTKGSGHPMPADGPKMRVVAEATWATWAILSGADSVLSEIFHRYRSKLPDDVARDVEAAYMDCRKESERIKAELKDSPRVVNPA